VCVAFWTMAATTGLGADLILLVSSTAMRRSAVLYTRPLCADYHGIVQCDGYRAYKKLNQNRIVLAFCWTQGRGPHRRGGPGMNLDVGRAHAYPSGFQRSPGGVPCLE